MRALYFEPAERSRLLWALTIYGGFVLIAYREPLIGSILVGATSQIASITASILQSFEQTATVNGNLIVLSSGESYEISYRCLGILPMACLTVCIIASQARVGTKAIGVCFGVVFLSVVNEVRIVDLILIHSRSPESFHFAHDVMWGSVPILLVPLFFIAWRHWAGHRDGKLHWRATDGNALRSPCRS